MRKWVLTIGGLWLLAGCGPEDVSRSPAPAVAIAPRVDTVSTEYGEIKLAARIRVTDGKFEFTTLDGEPYDASIIDEKTRERILTGYYSGEVYEHGFLFIYPDGMHVPTLGPWIMSDGRLGSGSLSHGPVPYVDGLIQHSFFMFDSEELADSIEVQFVFDIGKLIAQGDWPTDGAPDSVWTGTLPTTVPGYSLELETVPFLLRLRVEEPVPDAKYDLRLLHDRGIQPQAHPSGPVLVEEAGEHVFEWQADEAVYATGFFLYEQEVVTLEFSGLNSGD